MYLGHYGLNEPPFSITPDPRFVFLSERHRDALAHLLFGITQGGGGGFVQLTGEVGTGKTTLSRLLLEQLPDNARVALVLNPRMDATELLETVCEELRLDLEGRRGSAKALIDALNAYLLDAYAQGLRVVLLIDEAQNLPVETLEQVRLLTNLETDTQKLLQVILLGQPELRDKLERPDLRQLAQRITARFHLMPLDAVGTADYLRHRYRVAGGQHFPFTARAVQRMHVRARGVPRLLNVIAERALLAGYARDLSTLDEGIVEEAAREALPPAPGRVGHAIRWLPALGVLVLAGVVFALWPRTPTVKETGSESSRATASAARRAPNQQATATPGPKQSAATRTPRLDADAFDAQIEGAEPLAAWGALLQAWQLPHTASDRAAASSCTPTLAAGVYCARGTSGMDGLVAIGRPVLLSLRASGRTSWAVLLGADATHARMVLDGAPFDVDRVALEGAWRGDYMAVWRGPMGLVAPLSLGDVGPAVDWVRTRLTSDGERDSTASVGFDAALAARVRRFQRAHGMAVDGVVGPETMFALGADSTGPRLLTALE